VPLPGAKIRRYHTCMAFAAQSPTKSASWKSGEKVPRAGQQRRTTTPSRSTRRTSGAPPPVTTNARNFAVDSPQRSSPGQHEINERGSPYLLRATVPSASALGYTHRRSVTPQPTRGETTSGLSVDSISVKLPRRSATPQPEKPRIRAGARLLPRDSTTTSSSPTSTSNASMGREGRGEDVQRQYFLKPRLGGSTGASHGMAAGAKSGSRLKKGDMKSPGGPRSGQGMHSADESGPLSAMALGHTKSTTTTKLTSERSSARGQPILNPQSRASASLLISHVSEAEAHTHPNSLSLTQSRGDVPSRLPAAGEVTNKPEHRRTLPAPSPIESFFRSSTPSHAVVNGVEQQRASFGVKPWVEHEQQAGPSVDHQITKDNKAEEPLRDRASSLGDYLAKIDEEARMTKVQDLPTKEPSPDAEGAELVQNRAALDGAQWVPFMVRLLQENAALRERNHIQALELSDLKQHDFALTEKNRSLEMQLRHIDQDRSRLEAESDVLRAKLDEVLKKEVPAETNSPSQSKRDDDLVLAHKELVELEHAKRLAVMMESVVNFTEKQTTMLSSAIEAIDVQ